MYEPTSLCNWITQMKPANLCFNRPLMWMRTKSFNRAALLNFMEMLLDGTYRIMIVKSFRAVKLKYPSFHSDFFHSVNVWGSLLGLLCIMWHCYYTVWPLCQIIFKAQLASLSLSTTWKISPVRHGCTSRVTWGKTQKLEGGMAGRGSKVQKKRQVPLKQRFQSTGLNAWLGTKELTDWIQDKKMQVKLIRVERTMKIGKATKAHSMDAQLFKFILSFALCTVEQRFDWIFSRKNTKIKIKTHNSRGLCYFRSELWHLGKLSLYWNQLR